MKVGERGQVTIPRDIRERFGITRDSEMEFHVEGGEIVLRKISPPLELEKWKGYCGGSLASLGLDSVDEYIAEVRGH